MEADCAHLCSFFVGSVHVFLRVPPLADQCGQHGDGAVVLLCGHGFGVDLFDAPPALLCGASSGCCFAAERKHGGGVGVAGRVVVWVGGIVVAVWHGVSL